MQKWEYFWTTVSLVQEEQPSGERGLFGGEKKQIVGRWVAWWSEGERLERLELSALLNKAGALGWELVGTPISEARHGGGGLSIGFTYTPPHLLYFKRPIS